MINKNNKIHTPALIIDNNCLVKNIKTMSRYAKNNNISIRPHAKSHKISYIKINNHKNLKNKISKVLKSSKAVICELIMNPDEEQIPKAINRRDISGKSIPTEFEDMYPFLPRDELTSNQIK